jgi:uncharacterized protein (DUF2267 family)
VTDREFLRRVRERARLADERSARQVAEAVLRQLVGRISWGEKHDLAAVLPPRLGRVALAAANTDLAYAPAHAFVRDLADDLEVSPAEAQAYAEAAASVLAELLAPGQLQSLRAQLHGVYPLVFG